MHVTHSHSCSVTVSQFHLKPNLEIQMALAAVIRLLLYGFASFVDFASTDPLSPYDLYF